LQPQAGRRRGRPPAPRDQFGKVVLVEKVKSVIDHTAACKQTGTNVNMRIAHLNIRSAGKKAEMIHDMINSHRLDILFLTETWYTVDQPPAVVDDVPEGYSTFHVMRGGNKGGGGFQ